MYNFHNPQPFARTQPSHTLFATKSVTYPFALTLLLPIFRILPIAHYLYLFKPLTFPLLTSYITFAEGNFGNCRFQRHHNVSTFLLLYYLPLLQLTSPLGVYQNPNSYRPYSLQIASREIQQGDSATRSPAGSFNRYWRACISTPCGKFWKNWCYLSAF